MKRAGAPDCSVIGLTLPIDVTVEAAQAAGGEFAMAPTEIPDGNPRPGDVRHLYWGGIQYQIWQQ